MLDIDYVAGSKSDPDSTSSYDAITIRFKADDEASQKVVIIDGGFSDIGNDVVNSINEHYGTNEVDLMICTHPDSDHLNGLITAIQQLDVKELWIHQPANYKDDLSEFTNLENLNTLLAFAAERNVTVTDPFTGLTRFDDRIIVLGPTEDYYKQLLDEQLDPAVKAAFAARKSQSRLAAAISNVFERALSSLPMETLGNGGVTHPRNNSSVITLLDFDGKKYLFTGDAGIPALEAAADKYEDRYGSFAEAPLTVFQAPHHGSKHNLGRDILNRILGEHGAPHNSTLTTMIHSAKASLKHPSPKVTNAVMRRGTSPNKLAVTNGQSKWHHHNSIARAGWSSIDPYPILAEDE